MTPVEVAFWLGRRRPVGRQRRPVQDVGRDLRAAHRELAISEGDWAIFETHLEASHEALRIAAPERDEVRAFRRRSQGADRSSGSAGRLLIAEPAAGTGDGVHR